MSFELSEVIAAKKALLVQGRRVCINTPILRGIKGTVLKPPGYTRYEMSPDCLVQLDDRELPLSFYQHEVDLI